MGMAQEGLGHERDRAAHQALVDEAVLGRAPAEQLRQEGEEHLVRVRVRVRVRVGVRARVRARARARARVRVRVRVRLRQGGGEHLVDALAPGGSGQRAQLRVEQRALQRHDRRVAHLIKG